MVCLPNAHHAKPKYSLPWSIAVRTLCRKVS